RRSNGCATSGASSSSCGTPRAAGCAASSPPYCPRGRTAGSRSTSIPTTCCRVRLVRLLHPAHHGRSHRTALLLVAAIAAAGAAHASLLVSSNGAAKVVRLDPASGAVLGDVMPAGAGGLSHPDGLVVGPDGNLYVCAEGDSAVLRYDADSGAFL